MLNIYNSVKEIEKEIENKIAYKYEHLNAGDEYGYPEMSLKKFTAPFDGWLYQLSSHSNILIGWAFVPDVEK